LVRQTGRQKVRQVGRQAFGQVDRPTVRQTGIQTDKEVDTQTIDTQSGIRTGGRQRSSQTDRVASSMILLL
jgi:hypothetical protein